MNPESNTEKKAPVTPTSGTAHRTRPPQRRSGGGMRRGNFSRPRSGSRGGFRSGGDTRDSKKPADIVPPIAPGIIRIIPLGGVEEVGKNMTAIEYGDNIIVIDCGFQFREEATPGIDYILPNPKYLEERKGKIKAVFITHGHLDHIGAIPYIMNRIGNPPLYTAQFGAMMIQKRQEEFPQVPKLDLRILDANQRVTIAPDFKIATFPISHTIPDSIGLIVETPFGNIVFIEDVRVDNIKGVPTEEEFEQYKRFKDMNVLLLTMDSTSIEKPGFSLSEQTVIKNIEEIIRLTKSRLIIATFASQVERLIAMIEICRRLNKKVVFEGRSMKTNLEIIKKLELVNTDQVVIPLEEVEQYAPDRIVMIVTGAQGEEFAALMRIANKTHKYIQLRQTDTVLLSSSIIPTNYNAVINLKDTLYRSGAKIITYLDSDVHASGHGNRDELRWIHSQMKYRFFMPLHGNHYMLRQHAELAYTMGVPKENVIVPDNGSVIEIYDEGQKIRVIPQKAVSSDIIVDGFAIGDVQEVVMRDRKMLAEDGFVVIIASVNTQTGKLKKSPDIISRGFVYLRESQELLQQARMLIKRSIEKSTEGMNPINFDFVKSDVTETVERFLLQKTAKRPIVIPVVLGV